MMGLDVKALRLAALAAVAIVLQAAAPAPGALEQAFRDRDQAMLDAIAPGDRAVWDKVMAADAAYVDENGEVIPRAEFLKRFLPLPKGATGQLKIVDYQVHFDGLTATVIHRDDERETYHGAPLRAGYLTTETWVKQGGDWKLVLAHTYVVAVDPPSIPVPAPALDGYVGRYRMNDLAYVVRRDGDHLVGGSEGAPGRPLLAEAPDLFFTPGQPRTRRIFRRDAAHHVIDMVDRREGEDLIWVRQPG
jgi:hypothetical protein